MNHVVFLAPHIRTTPLGLVVLRNSFTPRRKRILSKAGWAVEDSFRWHIQRLRHESNNRFLIKAAVCLQSVALWSRGGQVSRWALRTTCWEQSVEEPTSNSSQPSNAALTVHVQSAQKPTQDYFIDVSEKVTNQHFTVTFNEKVKLSVLRLLC